MHLFALCSVLLLTIIYMASHHHTLATITQTFEAGDPDLAQPQGQRPRTAEGAANIREREE